MVNMHPDVEMERFNSPHFFKDIFLYFFIKLKIYYPSYSINKIECANPLTPTSDQDTISPYNINTISSR